MAAPLGGIVNLGGDHNATTWIHFLENSSQVFSRSKTRMQILVWFARGNSKLCYDDHHRIEMGAQHWVICWVWCGPVMIYYLSRFLLRKEGKKKGNLKFACPRFYPLWQFQRPTLSVFTQPNATMLWIWTSSSMQLRKLMQQTIQLKFQENVMVYRETCYFTMSLICFDRWTWQRQEVTFLQTSQSVWSPLQSTCGRVSASWGRREQESTASWSAIASSTLSPAFTDPSSSLPGAS